jgi:hypothetical protein
LKEIRNGGSYEKGTMLKYHPEADIVFVFNKQSGKSRNWIHLMDIVKKNILDNFPDVKFENSTTIAHNILFMNGDEKVHFDIVPSYYVNSPLQVASHYTSKVYQGITTIWHVEYVKQHKNLPYFTEAVRLLKDWKNEHDIKIKSFCLELIAISAYKWRVENRNSLDNIVYNCFKEIQGMTDGKSVFPVDWDTYFTDDDITDDFTIPCIIDPANPKDNLLKKMTEEQSRYLKKEAVKAMSLMENEEYGNIFDPRNVTKYFQQQ